MKIALVFRLVTVMLLWASCYPLITVGLELAPHLAFATMRAGIAGFVLLAIAVILHRPLPRDTRSWAVLSLVGLGSTGFGFLGMFHAAEFISPGLATVVANTQPLLAAVLAHSFLKERLTGMGWAGLALGFAGIVSIAAPGLGPGVATSYWVGFAYITVAAVGVSAGNIGMKLLPERMDALAGMGIQLLLGAVPLGLLSAATEDWGEVSWSPTFALVLVMLAVFGTSLAFWLWFGALRQVALNRANAFTFLVPIFGLSIGVMFFGERLDWPQAVGAALVIVGIGLVQFRGMGGARPATVDSW
ncbi:MAG: transporter [Alphaproteobacteria bacterium]|nr:MAG: transporter [Alphaproteobacteria bacterium]